MEGMELARRIAELADEKKGFEIKILDVKGVTSGFDYCVLISGSVDQHLKAMSEHIRKELSREGVKPIGYEGESNMKWVLIDYVDVVVHLFEKETRHFYNLESLWPDAKIEEIASEELTF